LLYATRFRTTYATRWFALRLPRKFFLHTFFFHVVVDLIRYRWVICCSRLRCSRTFLPHCCARFLFLSTPRFPTVPAVLSRSNYRYSLSTYTVSGSFRWILILPFVSVLQLLLRTRTKKKKKKKKNFTYHILRLRLQLPLPCVRFQLHTLVICGSVWFAVAVHAHTLPGLVYHHGCPSHFALTAPHTVTHTTLHGCSTLHPPHCVLRVYRSSRFGFTTGYHYTVYGPSFGYPSYRSLLPTQFRGARTTSFRSPCRSLGSSRSHLTHRSFGYLLPPHTTYLICLHGVTCKSAIFHWPLTIPPTFCGSSLRARLVTTPIQFSPYTPFSPLVGLVFPCHTTDYYQFYHTHPPR